MKEAKQLLATFYSFGVTLKSKDITIFNKKNKKVTELDEKLINLKDEEDKILFDIPILTEFAAKNKAKEEKEAKNAKEAKKAKKAKKNPKNPKIQKK